MKQPHLIMMAIVLIATSSLVMATPVSNTIVVDDIEYLIQADKPVYDFGQDVEMLYRVTNLTDEDVRIVTFQSPEFNFVVTKEQEAIWALVHWFIAFSPGVPLSAGEFKEISYSWDMINDNGNLVGPGIYDVIGVTYTLPQIEVGVPISIVPEPATLLLLSLAGLKVLSKHPFHERGY